MALVLFLPEKELKDMEEIIMGEVRIPIAKTELPSKEEALAKLEAVFKDIDLTNLLNLHVKSFDDSRYGFENLICDLYPTYRALSRFERSYLGAYLKGHYTLDIDYFEYEAIIPEGKEITKRE